MEKLKLLISSCRGMIRCAATAVLLTVGMAAAAQTVSISPKTGNVISAASYGTESHKTNFGGVWIHNQLPMTLITSDEATITAAGLMKVHANNVSAIEKENKLTFISGQGSTVNHMSLSLPKGYRFTSYKMVINSNDDSPVATTLKEMDASFTTVHASVFIKKTGSEGVTMQRTSMNNSDMGNILYFKQDHDYARGGSSTIDVVSFVVTFECTDKFNESLQAEPDAFTDAVSCLALPFLTNRVDYGPIEIQTVNNYTSFKYDYNNIKDLEADFLLYDEKGVVGGTAKAGTPGDGSIASVSNDGKLTYIGLKNNTYWLETPTDALTENGQRIPVGYRIVGARLVYANSAKHVDFKKGDQIYITDGNGRYMNSSLEFTANKVVWTYGTDGKVYTKSGYNTYYLAHNYTTNNNKRFYYLDVTTRSRNAAVYNTKGLNLFIGSGAETYFVSCNADGKGVYNYAQGMAVVVNTITTEASSTGFTIKIFDKTGTTVEHEGQASAEHPEGELVLEKINNDAIKLQIEGLEEGQKAYVCFQVQLEALNPYIDKMDITCTQPSGEQALKKQYLADDFTIGTDGKVDFGVPTNFGTTGLRFAFDGLHSKSADETYPAGQVGKYSRYHFVKSDYYDLIGENLQAHRSEAANYDYTKKVRVDVAGDKAFHCNNSDKFKAGTTGSGTFYYEEYRYSNDAYNTQGGQWKEMVANNGDNYVKRYLVVCDETRYNIAPTTTPRHAIYAYYSTDLKLTTVDYKPEITYTKVYDDAVIPTGPDKNYYVGATLRLKDKAGSLLPEGTGYAYTKQIIDQINADIAAHKTNAPVDANHILYFDASNVNSLLFSSNNAAWGQLEDLKSKLGMNALIFLPTGVTDNHDNVASKSLSGDDFIAENNIVLEDQWPFFSPYDIRINAANEVSYKRFVANNNDTKKWVSIVMPFTVAINAETGQYTNEDDKCDFTFYQMNATNAFSKPNSSGDLIFTDIDGHFSPYAGVSTTQPNDAYIVRIDRAEMTEKEAKLMFILRQRGSTIVKTPMGRTIQGAASSGTVDGQNMDLIPQATFSGAEVDRTKGIFYFNKDKFVSSLALEMSNTVKVLPFRSYYDCTGTGVRNIRYINISLEPNNDPTDIQEVTSKATNAGFVFSSQAGQLTVKATKDLRVNVRNVSGQTIDVKALKAGESHSVKLPSGIYVVNGTKVMVR
ncbi:hypothetical protein [Hallella sp.]|uniref:hypothetical protein n=1 Tax=Hallella sp. TaxID=2980186 RepID=UPI00307FE6F9